MERMKVLGGVVVVSVQPLELVWLRSSFIWIHQNDGGRWALNRCSVYKTHGKALLEPFYFTDPLKSLPRALIKTASGRSWLKPYTAQWLCFSDAMHVALLDLMYVIPVQ